ncbi:MAG TPA: response regulator transcription factor [Haloplasmataceae bacterium]
MAKILIIEDEQSIQRLLTYDLQQAGYEVEVASSGDVGFQMATTGDYDLILLDVMLPKMDGITLCKRLREQNKEVYIIMLTARSDEMDKVTGLEAGADDYITKPFSPREVLARIRAGLRRKGENLNDKLKVGNVSVDLKRYEAYIDDELIPLTKKEFQLLVYLMKNKGITLSRDVLLETLWGFEYDGDTRIVDVHIFKLREKLADSTIEIVTVRGVGYRLEEPSDEE